MFGANFVQETDLSGDGDGEGEGEEGACVWAGVAVCARHGSRTAQARTNKKVAREDLESGVRFLRDDTRILA